MASLLLAVSPIDVADDQTTHALLEFVYNQGVKFCYVLLIGKLDYLTLNRLLDNIYNVSRNINGAKSSTALVLITEDHATRVTYPWDCIRYTESVDVNSIPLPYIPAHVTPKELGEVTTTKKAFEKAGNGIFMNHYHTSAVGGTFDHLHDGHRILLTIAAFVTNDCLIVGVTGPQLLKNKKYSEYLEPYDLREEKVKSFINTLRPNLKVQIEQINDVCGPTAHIRDIEALIISKESAKGAEFVNKTRKEKNWKELECVVIDVIGGRKSDFKDKLSSTDYRQMEAQDNNEN